MTDYDRPHIKVIQYMYGKFNYFPLSERINRSYCQRHGYEYLIDRNRPVINRHICWQKVPYILRELHDCDYVLFLDADAFFYGQEFTIENEMIPLLNNKSILMAQDCGAESYRWTPGYPNTGVILTKVNEESREFFTHWNNVSRYDPSTRWTWPPEQLALWRHVIPTYSEALTVIADYYLIQGIYGLYIRHLIGMSDDTRTRIMGNYLNGIPCIWGNPPVTCNPLHPDPTQPATH